jgi:homoaconitase/3-isopropylmalate dehydratase large subunit
VSGKTIAEKILGKHAGHDVTAGEIVLCDVDLIMFHDANGPLAIRAFEDMGGKRVFNPEKIVVVLTIVRPLPTRSFPISTRFCARSFKNKEYIFMREAAVFAIR